MSDFDVFDKHNEKNNNQQNLYLDCVLHKSKVLSMLKKIVYKSKVNYAKRLAKVNINKETQKSRAKDKVKISKPKTLNKRTKRKKIIIGGLAATILSAGIALTAVVQAQSNSHYRLNSQYSSYSTTYKTLEQAKILDSIMLPMDPEKAVNGKMPDVCKELNIKEQDKAYSYAKTKMYEKIFDIPVSRADGTKVFNRLMKKNFTIDNIIKSIGNLKVIEAEANLLKCLGYNVKMSEVSKMADEIGITKDTNCIGIENKDTEIKYNQFFQFIYNALNAKTVDGKNFGEKFGLIVESKEKTSDTLVIAVNFKDTKIKNTDEQLNNIIFGKTAGLNNEDNSVSQRFKAMTYDKVDLKPAKESYGTKNDGIVSVNIDENYQKIANIDDFKVAQNVIMDMNTEILKQADKYVDFSQFDLDGNKKLTSNEPNIVIVFGNAQDGGMLREFRAFAGPILSVSEKLTLDGVEINPDTDIAKLDKSTNKQAASSYCPPRAVYISEEYCTAKNGLDNTTILKGILSHELSHLVIGAKDLYRENGVSGIHMLDIMNDSRAQSAFSAYTLKDTKLIKPEEISLNDDKREFELSLGPNEIIKVNTNDPNEYYLVRNRSFTGVDKELSTYFAGNGMIVIYKVNELLTNFDAKDNEDQLVTVVNPEHNGMRLFFKEGDEFCFSTDTISDYNIDKSNNTPVNAAIKVLKSDGDKKVINVRLLNN